MNWKKRRTRTVSDVSVRMIRDATNAPYRVVHSASLLPGFTPEYRAEYQHRTPRGILPFYWAPISKHRTEEAAKRACEKHQKLSKKT